MPTYDYHCAKCKKTYETREGFSAPTTHKCQECGKGTAKRVLTAPRILFKGSGWYVTDSKGKSAATTDSDSGSTAASSAGSDTKSESKGESKTESKPAKSESTSSSTAPAG